MEEFDNKFNTNFSNGEIDYGVEGLSRADVHDWEDGVGMREGNRSGLVRYGYKEVDMFEQRANRVLGKNNSVTGWLRRHMDDVSQSQNPGRDRFIRGVEDALLDLTDEELKAGNVGKGEMVIKTDGDTFHETDLEGRRMVRMNDGVTEISAKAFNDIPAMTERGQQLTVGDMKGSILDLSGTANGLQKIGPDGNPVDADLDKLLKKNGSMLMELPGNDFKRKYVRMLDTGVNKIGAGEEAMPVLKDLQKSQLNLWRLTKEYSADQDSNTKERLEGALDKYEKTLARTYSSSKGGSVSDLRSGRLNMSGRFRIQGINPFANKDGKYKEGTVYVGQGRAEEMIEGAERKIGKAVGIEGIDDMSDPDVKNKVLAHMKGEGLYSTVNRYPTIAEDTMQVLNFKIDDAMDKNSRQGFFTVGTAMRMKADYDGDFFSSVLSHYKYDKDDQGVGAEDIHQAYKKIHESDMGFLEDAGRRMTTELEEEASVRGVTLGSLMSDKDYRDSFNAKWQPKVGSIYDRESAIARRGKSDVGVLDNLRQKMSNVGNSTYKILEGTKGYSSEEVLEKKRKIDDIGRLFSQEAISAKKFSAEALSKEGIDLFGDSDPFRVDEYVNERMDMRDKAIDMIKSGFEAPDETGRKNIIEGGKILGIFDDPDTPGLRDTLPDGTLGMNARGADGSVSNSGVNNKIDYSINSSLDEVMELHTLSGGESGNWVHNRFQQLGMSEGDQDPERLSNTIRGKGDRVSDSPGAVGAAVEGSQMQKTLDEGERRIERSVYSNLENMRGGAQATSDTLERAVTEKAGSMMNGLTVGERAGSKISSFMNNAGGSSLSGMSGARGAMMGAGMFGAMWATSALMRGGPTPEGLQEQTQQGPEAINPLSGQQPTARVAENDGENINIRVSAKNAKNMSEEDISALVHQEVSAMTQMDMNVDMNVNDNTQNIDQQWLQGVVANAIDKGFGY
jgi:hypothetical protein